MPAITVFNSLYKAQDHIIALHVKYGLIQTKGMKSAEGAVYSGGGERTPHLICAMTCSLQVVGWKNSSYYFLQ